MMFQNIKRLIFLTLNSLSCLLASSQVSNQTAFLSPVLLNQSLPFEVKLELEDFSLPNGIHSYAQATYQGKWLFIAGRTNGLHGFSPGNNNFPPSAQNQVVYVVDPVAKMTFARSLNDPFSGLTMQQIDSLSVTSPQFYTSKSTLYMTGGYGVDSTTGFFSTKDALTAIDVAGLMHWVTDPVPNETAGQYIRQIFDPVFQITGGYMTQIQNHPTLLVFGQNFQGSYHTNSNGAYSKQVRRFHIIDDGIKLGVKVLSPKPHDQEAAFRRRDLNVVPIISHENGRYRQKLIAFAGVFTLETGVWTVPVIIDAKGKPCMPDPFAQTSFKQAMNHYICPTIGLFSKKSCEMYTIFLGGISFGYFVGNQLETDSEIPFINQITTISYDKNGKYTQSLMDEEYPEILSTQSNPGNPLLFGAGAQFIAANKDVLYGNGVLNLDALNEPTLIGYVVGGIQSSLPNTNGPSDSAASPYIFKVILRPAS